MDASSENKNRYIALVLTIGFHALLFLLFIFIVFITPIPAFETKPVPEVFADLGMVGQGNMDAGGSGNNDKELTTTQDVAVKTAPVVSNDAPNVVTDPTETAVSVKTNPKNVKENKTETPVTEEEKASVELQNALAKMHSLKDHKGQGEGTKQTGGTGNGNKQGVGDGPGNGIGDGPPGGNGVNDYYLKGRSLLRKPDRMTDAKEEGVVVVDIVVDETGKVIEAKPGSRGTTTFSSVLWAKARGAAMEIKFSPSPDGIKEQHGTYKFVFTLE